MIKYRVWKLENCAEVAVFSSLERDMKCRTAYTTASTMNKTQNPNMIVSVSKGERME
jgi:hypothetical protein